MERVGTRVNPHGGSTIESTPPHLVVNSNTFIHSCVNPELEMVHPLSKHEIVERVSSNRIKTRMKMLNIQRNSKSRELKKKKFTRIGYLNTGGVTTHGFKGNSTH